MCYWIWFILCVVIFGCWCVCWRYVIVCCGLCILVYCLVVGFGLGGWVVCCVCVLVVLDSGLLFYFWWWYWWWWLVFVFCFVLGGCWVGLVWVCVGWCCLVVIGVFVVWSICFGSWWCVWLLGGWLVILLYIIVGVCGCCWYRLCRVCFCWNCGIVCNVWFVWLFVLIFLIGVVCYCVCVLVCGRLCVVWFFGLCWVVFGRFWLVVWVGVGLWWWIYFRNKCVKFEGFVV